MVMTDWSPAIFQDTRGFQGESITVEGAGATFNAPLQEPWP